MKNLFMEAALNEAKLAYEAGEIPLSEMVRLLPVPII